jgi:hypothetical protein
MESQPESDSPRKNRARDRHQRRKERQQGMAHAVNVPRQLRPADSFTLPKIRMPSNRLLIYVLGGAIFIMLVIYVLSRLKNDEPLPDPNAIWIGSQWTYENPSDESITTLVGHLRENHVGTAYAWVSLLQPDGAWTEVNRLESVKMFVERFRNAYPTVKLFGWLSIGSQAADGSNRLGDTTAQQVIADFSQRMVGEFGFDGVLLNIVPVVSGDESYLALLRKVRVSLGENGLLGVAVPPDWTPIDAEIPTPSQIAPGTVWAEDYKQRVALLADQVFVATYNAGFSTSEDYSAWVAYQVETFAKAIADLDTTTELLIGVPTYDLVPPDHDPGIENPTSAISGLRAGLAGAGDASRFVHGIGIYAEWETSAEEWDQIKSLWGNP